MTTVRELCTRALRRTRVFSPHEPIDAVDMADTLAALNDMLFAWPTENINMLVQSDFVLADTFSVFVPPAATQWNTIEVVSYQGTWDANANSPTLATGTGTNGHVYKVTTAGSTTLDSVTSWSVGDWAVFDGTNGEVWRKGISTHRVEQAVSALLGRRMAEEFGFQPTQALLNSARDGEKHLESLYIRPPSSQIFDSALVRAPSNRYQDYIASDYDG